jgi:hypothetical protein
LRNGKTAKSSELFPAIHRLDYRNRELAMTSHSRTSLLLLCLKLPLLAALLIGRLASQGHAPVDTDTPSPKAIWSTDEHPFGVSAPVDADDTSSFESDGSYPSARPIGEIDGSFESPGGFPAARGAEPARFPAPRADEVTTTAGYH